jgi:hypothetical protein
VDVGKATGPVVPNRWPAEVQPAWQNCTCFAVLFAEIAGARTEAAVKEPVSTDSISQAVEASWLAA